MLNGLQSVGWFLRRTPSQSRLGTFYREVLHLPQIRQHGDNEIFWLGETVVLGVNRGGAVLDAVARPDEASCVPVLAVADLGEMTTRLQAAGVRFLSERVDAPGGRRSYFFDLDNNVMAIQERDMGLDWPESVEGVRRLRAGLTSVPDAPPMTPGIQHLGWIVIHCRDVTAMTEFYHRVGLPFRRMSGASALFDLGEVVTLELSPGNPPLVTPEDRDQANSAFVLRVADVNAAVSDLRARGIAFVNEPFDIGGGRVGYIADPEGHVLGIQTRWESSDRVEDREARRRVAAGSRPT